MSKLSKDQKTLLWLGVYVALMVWAFAPWPPYIRLTGQAALFVIADVVFFKATSDRNWWLATNSLVVSMLVVFVWIFRL